MDTASSVEIRRLQRGDADDLIALIVESFADELALAHAGSEGIRGQLGAVLAAGRPPLSLPLRAFGYVAEFWVAVEGGSLLGCYALSGGPRLTVSTVAVRPAHRRAGLGRALMEHAFARARALRKRYVILEVLSDNHPAVALYTSVGMREYDRRRSYSLNLYLYVHEAAPSGALSFAPVRRAHLHVWPWVLQASVAREALPLEDAYRSEYLSASFGRWAGMHLSRPRTLRETVLLSGEPVGFVCVRSVVSQSQQMAEIPPPLYTDEAQPHVHEIVQAATGSAAQSRVPLSRLYLSEARPEGWEAALSLGYVFERVWLYMYAAV